MPHARSTILIALPLLALLAGCSNEPARTGGGSAELPVVRSEPLGIGLDGHRNNAGRLDDPEDPTLPSVPTDRSLDVFTNNAGRSAVNASDPIYDLDSLPRNPGEVRTANVPPATPSSNDTARLTAAEIAARPTSSDLYNLLVGGPAGVFATLEGTPTLGDTPPGDVTTDLQTLLATLERMTGDAALEAGLPLGPALKAGALEALTPGALERALGELGDDSPFTPDERALLGAWARLHRTINLVEADPMDVASALRTAADETAALLPMRIATLDLCTSVDGFGTYTPFFRRDDAVLLASGSARRMIVYAELDRFETRAVARGSVEGFEVDLTQSIELVHLDKGDGAADLVAWRQPAERISDFSRNRRRDFYTLQIIELPGTLSIGRYHLRLTTVDRHTGEEAQAVVPIDVVALPDLKANTERGTNRE